MPPRAANVIALLSSSGDDGCASWNVTQAVCLFFRKYYLREQQTLSKPYTGCPTTTRYVTSAVFASAPTPCVRQPLLFAGPAEHQRLPGVGSGALPATARAVRCDAPLAGKRFIFPFSSTRLVCPSEMTIRRKAPKAQAIIKARG